MRTLLFIAVALALSLPTPSLAQQFGNLRLAWSECGEAGTLNNAFACTNNDDVHLLVSSFVAPQFPSLSHVVGTTTEVVLAFDLSGMPSWWQLGPSGCRSGALSSADVGALGLTGCANPFEGSQNLGLSYFEAGYLGNPRLARITVDLARSDPGVPLAPGTEYVANVIQIRSTKTSGPGACDGCSQLVCIELDRVHVAQVDFAVTLQSMPGTTPTRVSWGNDPYGYCFGVVGARKQTWGAVKSLYR